MKILCTSDWHPDWVTAGVPRFDDVQETVERTVDYALAEGVDAYFFLGDLCDPGTSRSYRAIALLIRVAMTLAEEGIQVICLTGNHDVIEDGSGSSTLAPLEELGCVYVVSRPALTAVTPNGAPPLNVLCLPFTPRSHPYDPEEVVREHAKNGGDDIHLVIGHLNIEGIAAGSETTDLPRGRQVFFPYELCKELLPNATLLNGHYHERQHWRGKGGKDKQGIHIPGAPQRLTFSEEQNDPGFFILEVEHG